MDPKPVHPKHMHPMRSTEVDKLLQDTLSSGSQLSKDKAGAQPARREDVICHQLLLRPMLIVAAVRT